MKMIVRVDDVGYTKTHNDGTFRTIEQGIATAADVMLDTAGAEDALQRLKMYPWISVGWHTHFWGKPVLPEKEVRGLVMENGHFKPNILEDADVSYEEAKKELQAELKFCKKILGRIPAYCGTISGNGPFAKALKDVCEENNIAVDFMTSIIGKDFMPDLPDDARVISAGEKWIGRKIICPDVPYVRTLFADSLDEILKYGPMSREYFIHDQGEFLKRPKDEVIVTIWHPGYIDTDMMYEGESGNLGRRFDHCRLSDVYTLCSLDMREWVKNNRVELMNFTDALYGKNDYQDHLRESESELAV